ncbi:hypothetical protein C8R44DRAFT_750566 [Mycena epipterygia]|nr:hypothetical protein C8R44DRAFT_750566 [Mycena epipterygia]
MTFRSRHRLAIHRRHWWSDRRIVSPSSLWEPGPEYILETPTKKMITLEVWQIGFGRRKIGDEGEVYGQYLVSGVRRGTLIVVQLWTRARVGGARSTAKEERWRRGWRAGRHCEGGGGGAGMDNSDGTPTVLAAAHPSREEGRSWGGMKRVDGDILVRTARVRPGPRASAVGMTGYWGRMGESKRKVKVSDGLKQGVYGYEEEI